MYPVNLNLKRRNFFSAATLSEKVRNQWQGAVILIVLLFVLAMAVSTDIFEAEASELLVMDQGPCLIYTDQDFIATPTMITARNFDVRLDVCVRIIGALSSTYPASSMGWVYGQHIGSLGEFHIAIQAQAEDNHSAWVKNVGETTWIKYADNWWESPEVMIQ